MFFSEAIPPRVLTAFVIVMALLMASADSVFAAEGAPPAPEGEGAPPVKEALSFEEVKKAIADAKSENALKDMEALGRKGDEKAQLFLGDIYLEGDGVAANDSMAWHWYMKAAQKDNLMGIFKVARMYRKGLGVPYNLATAAMWYLKAAERDHMESQVFLGKIYAGKLGGAMIDFRKAENWLSKASKKGNFESELLLYEMYDGGYKPLSTRDQDLSDEETDAYTNAGRIRNMLLKAIKQSVPATSKLDIQGLLRVKEGEDGWFDVTIPPLRLSSETGSAYALGQVKFKFKPVEDVLDAEGNPRAYRVKNLDQRLVRFRFVAGGPQYIMTYKVRRFTGLWVPELNAFAESDAELSDFSIRDSGNTFVIKSERLVNVINLTESATGTWSGPSWMELAGITFSPPNGPVMAKLETATVDYIIEGYDPKALASKISEIVQLSLAKKSVKSKKPSLAFNVLIKAALNKGKAFDKAGLTVGGLDTLAFDLAFDLAYPLVSFGFSYNHDGLFVESADAKDLSAYVPYNANTEFRLERFPLAGMTSAEAVAFVMGLANIQGGTSNKSTSARRIEKKIYKILEKSKTQIVTEINFDALKAAMRGKGALKADARAFYGFSGNFDIMVRGLDDYIKTLAGNPDAAVKVLALTMISGLSRPHSAPDGATLDTYHIKLNRKGKVLVNGTDVMSVYQNIMAAMPKKPEPEVEAPKKKPAPPPDPPIQESPLP